MFALWVPITIAAAFLQNLRSVQQKALKGRLTTAGSAYARFLYAWPLAIIYVAGLWHFLGYDMPKANALFLIYCVLGGLCQILFTVVLLWMFSFRSFAVGTTFSKLEVILIAIMGALLLGDKVNLWAGFAILLGAIGTILLALTETKLTIGGLLRGMADKVTLVGLGSAALLGGSVVFFRAAALSLNGQDFLMTAAYTLAVTLVFQTLIMGLWFWVYDRQQLRAVVREWRYAAPIGLVGMLGSVGWFTAFTLQNAALVRALGQIELIFTYLTSVFYFREKVTLTEVIGNGLIVIAILIILLAG